MTDGELEKYLKVLVDEILRRPHGDRFAILNFITQGLLRGNQEQAYPLFPTIPELKRPQKSEGDTKHDTGES